VKRESVRASEGDWHPHVKSKNKGLNKSTPTPSLRSVKDVLRSRHQELLRMPSTDSKDQILAEIQKAWG
jgi:hypothetical protein